MSKHTDLTTLNLLASGDPAFLNALLSKISNQLPIAKEEINKCTSDQDWPGLKAIAHKTKSTIMHIGAKDLKDFLEKIEYSAGNNANLDKIPSWVADLNVLLDEVIEEISAAAK